MNSISGNLAVALEVTTLPASPEIKLPAPILDQSQEKTTTPQASPRSTVTYQKVPAGLHSRQARVAVDVWDSLVRAIARTFIDCHFIDNRFFRAGARVITEGFRKTTEAVLLNHIDGRTTSSGELKVQGFKALENAIGTLFFEPQNFTFPARILGGAANMAVRFLARLGFAACGFIKKADLHLRSAYDEFACRSLGRVIHIPTSLAISENKIAQLVVRTLEQYIGINTPLHHFQPIAKVLNKAGLMNVSSKLFKPEEEYGIAA